jgi:hypothetical protein
VLVYGGFPLSARHVVDAVSAKMAPASVPVALAKELVS